MAQYIPKDALLAEIDKRLHQLTDAAFDSMIGRNLIEIKDFIDTLEVKEVDLEKEFNDFLDDIEGVPPIWCVTDQLEWGKDIAKHFFELRPEQFKNELTAKEKMLAFFTTEELETELKKKDKVMKVNELQIGDYVNYRGQIIKVTSLYDKGGSNEVGWGRKEDTWVNASNVEPIPITAEILEKNGFDISDHEVKQYHFTEDGQRYHFSLRQMYNQKDNKPNGYSFYAFSVLTIIDYVHQLQHALKLCGIEKEIIL